LSSGDIMAMPVILLACQDEPYTEVNKHAELDPDARG